MVIGEQGMITEDLDEYGYSKGETSWKSIMMRIVLKISLDLSCKELRGGYNNVVIDNKGHSRETYVEDTREAFANGVMSLAYILQGKFDKEIKEYFDKFKQREEADRNKFIEESKLEEKEILGEAYYQELKDKVTLEEYKIARLRRYRELFEQLYLFLSRKNFFETGGATFS